MLDDLFGGGGSATYRTFSDLSPETQGAFKDINKRSMDLSSDAMARGEEIYGRNKEALQRATNTTGEMQGLSAGVARQGVADFQSMGRPLIDRAYRRSVLSDTQRDSKIDEAVGQVGAQFGQQEGAMARNAAMTAARYGIQLNPKQLAQAAAAKVGLMNQTRRQTVENMNADEANFYNMMAGREALGLQSAGAAAGQGGQFIQQTGGMQDVALGGMDAATRALQPAAGLTGQMIGSEFGQTPMVEEGDGGLFGALAPIAGLGMMAYGAPMGAAGMGYMMAGSGLAGMGRRRADGGPVYADGGEIQDPNAFELFPGSGVMATFADGGEIEDEMQPALQRADGAITQGDGSGGKLQGPGDGVSDSIPAITDRGEPIRVANGEYVVPKDVVDILGEDFFEHLIERLHTPAAIQREQGVA